MSLTLPGATPESSSRELVLAGGPVAQVAKILRRRGLEPNKAVFDEGRPDSTEEYQQQVYQEAWVNSLVRAGHSDYTRYKLAHLDEVEQHRDHFQKYIDHHAEARRHNRSQRNLPAEEQQIRRPKIMHMIVPGTTGAGKTVSAVAAGSYAVERGLMARFLVHSHYLKWMRPDGAPPGMTQLMVREFYERCDVLVLDDVCQQMDEYATNHVRDHTSDLISARMHSNRPTIFTTNRNSAQLTVILGEALVSRIGSRAQVLSMQGSDRRKPKTW
ncbi:ATP-binding protein [Streptomyces rubiginosohelvolus]|uniref:ATP-binding protein n=1 Tax=Streptomyces rubiginosohelvolus TaxID=67362 RepID=UPI0036528DA9